jgi:hypothetical protein
VYSSAWLAEVNIAVADLLDRPSVVLALTVGKYAQVAAFFDPDIGDDVGPCRQRLVAFEGLFEDCLELVADVFAEAFETTARAHPSDLGR